MPRFVLLEHDHPHLHWDFMLEDGPHLLTWRLAAPPGTAQSTHAEELTPHRLAYLDYEGAVSGGRGSVKCWDRGVYRTLVAEVTRRVVEVQGAKWSGVIELTKQESGEWVAGFRSTSAPVSGPSSA